MSGVKKAIGALLGAVTGGVVIAVAGALGKDIDPGLAVAIAGFCATLGTWLAPKNQPA